MSDLLAKRLKEINYLYKVMKVNDIARRCMMFYLFYRRLVICDCHSM